MPQDLATTLAVTSSARKSLRNTWVLICLLVLSLYALAVHAQTANDGFNPSANGDVQSSFVQSDGKIVVGGSFTVVGARSRAGVARLNIDGTADLGFDPGSGPNGDFVRVVADAGSGRVFVGGSFTSFSGKAAPLIVRLLNSGAVDSNFLPPSALTGTVFAIATQPDGNFLIGGQFTNNAGFSNLARLDITGKTDPNFAVNVNGPVFTIAVLPGGKMLIGGAFSTVNGQARTNFARLNSDGSLDTSYDAAISGVDSKVDGIVVQPDGKVIVVGFFVKVGGVDRQSIARLNTNGSLDISFDAVSADGTIFAVALQSDGRVLMSGGFGSVNGAPQPGIARLNQNGTLDLLHVTTINASVRAVSVQADGGVILSGSFSTINGVQRNCLARLTPAGFLDNSLDRDASGDALNGQVLAMAIRAGGEVVVGGEFTNSSPGPAFMQRLAPDGRRINSPSVPLTGPVRAIAIQADGNIVRGGSFSRGIDREIPGVGLDPLFNPGGAGAEAGVGIRGNVNAIAMLNGGKILIGGSFTTYNGEPRRNIARLNSDGTLDKAFIGPSALGDVNALTVQFNSGQILVGGFGYVLRLNPQGNIDTTFNVSLNLFAQVFVISFWQGANGTGTQHIFIGGSFSQVNGANAGNLAMLTSAGVRETTFTATTDAPVRSMIQQKDGRLIIGGAFTKVNNISSQRLAVVDNFTGALLTDYASAIVDGVVTALALQSDGKLLIGGNFTSVQNRSRSRIARFSAVGAVQPSLVVSKNLNGSLSVAFDMGQFGQAELSSFVNFELSTDVTNWTSLFGASALNGVAFITLGPAELPKGRLFYIRARARVPSGQGNGSSSPYEQIKQFYLPSTDARDLDGDAKSDLIFRNSSTGQISAWLMDGTTISSNAGLLGPASGWTVTHTADFNGDGKADILFRHVDGRVAMWLMDGTTLTSCAGLLEANSGWTVTHTADFNGDGKADILFRHVDGRVAMWLMDGTTLTSGAGLLEANSGWTVTHTGEFNGDGIADILFRHTDGRIAMWLMDGTTLLSGAGLLDAGSGWTATHTADFNGDGKADIIFRHADGRIAMWLMDGTTLTSGAGLLDAGSGWTATHTGDFNGDGKADILFRHVDGRVAMWLMDGITLTSGAGLLDAGTGWSVTHTGDFNGDRKADILFRNTDGQIAMWLMNGTTFIGGAGLLNAGSNLDVVPPAP